MNKTLKITLVVIGGIVLSAILFGAGMFVGRSSFNSAGYKSFSMMGQGFANQGYSMMGNGYNMMGGNGIALAPVTGACVGGNQSDNSANVKTITVDQAKQAIDGYLKGLNNPDLQLKEIMIFNNNAYARITEKSTGIGAMELLVDPASLSVFPEYGPNMMWNLKYGMMGRFGNMMGGNGMMGGYNSNPGAVSATMIVTSDQATKIAQDYLDQQFPGYQAAIDPDLFYGYYTIDIMKDGNPTGMLSVNGITGQVFLHTWHGTFIEKFE
jgi:hypothetical protein